MKNGVCNESGLLKVSHCLLCIVCCQKAWHTLGSSGKLLTVIALGKGDRDVNKGFIFTLYIFILFKLSSQE